jgi:hypothetical protein
LRGLAQCGYSGTVPGSIAAALANVTLRDADGQPVRLGSLWESGLAVVVFLRHYG